MCSYPVDVGKFAGKATGSYIAGKPNGYCIPLGCILVNEVGNLLMTGSKASYSSIAATSAGSLSAGIATGQAAGIVSVFSLIHGISPAEIETGKDQELSADLGNYLRSQKIKFVKVKPFEEEKAHWEYSAVRELLALGLLAGGAENDYCYDDKALQSDFAILLLNGIYRLDKDKYSLKLDSIIRPYSTKEPLTKQKAAEMLVALYEGGSKPGAPFYDEACKKGYINEVMRLRLKNRDYLNLGDLYYLASYSIKAYIND
jgi:hypothetical protein